MRFYVSRFYKLEFAILGVGNDVRSNVWKLTLFSILGSANLTMPIIALYYMGKGLSLAQIGSLAAVMAVAVLIFEVPSGVFADKKGRKFSLMICSAFSVFQFLILILGNNYGAFLVVAFLFGASNAFYSGAGVALLHDSLTGAKKVDFKRIRGKQISYGMWSFALAALIGGFLGGIDLRLPIAATLVLMILQFFVSLSLHEVRVKQKIDVSGRHFFDSVKFSFGHDKIKTLIIYSAVIVGFSDGMYRMFQPYFDLVGIGIQYFGVLYMASLIGAGFLARSAAGIEEKIGERLSILLIAVIFSGSYILMSAPIGIFIAVPFLVSSFLYGFLSPLIEDYTNRHVESGRRATVLSIQGFFQKLIIVLFIPVVGYFMDVSIPYGFLFVGVFGVLALIYPTYKLMRNY